LPAPCRLCTSAKARWSSKGDLLVTIDPAPYAAEVDRAEAQVVAAQARVSYTRSELERHAVCCTSSAIAQREHDERQNALREADANLRAAQAALQTAASTWATPR
jgi:multidrug efflux system membrane fusion protein